MQYPGGVTISGYTIDYELTEVALEYWPKGHGSGWQPVADLYGAWQAIEDGEGNLASSKLQLWTRTPFAFTRNSARTYRDAFLAAFPTWPCGEGREAETVCMDWFDAPYHTVYGTFFTYQGLTFLAPYHSDNPAFTAVAQGPTICREYGQQGLHFTYSLWVLFPEPIRTIEICLEDPAHAVRAHAGGIVVAELLSPPEGTITLEAQGIEWLEIDGASDNMALVRLCYTTEAEAAAAEWETLRRDTVQSSLESWESADPVLRPNTFYRLRVTTRGVLTKGGSVVADEAHTHTLHFQTGGPPGILHEDTLPTPDADALEHYPYAGKLTTLVPYVQHAIPAAGTSVFPRAYDLGIAFNENYIPQMYGADMLIRLRDANGDLATDAEGNPITLRNRWADNPATALEETEIPYYTRALDCENTISGALPADSCLRVQPDLLLFEDFRRGLDDWEATGVAIPLLAGRAVTLPSPTPIAGELYVAGDETWSDNMLEADLIGDGTQPRIDLFFRHTLDTDGFTHRYYHLTLSASGQTLRRVVGAESTLLWQSAAPYVEGTVTTVAVQYVGDRLRAHLDDLLLFDLMDDEPLLTGNIGIVDQDESAYAEIRVRAWPGRVLAPRTLYTAELVASYPLFYEVEEPYNPIWKRVGWTVWEGPTHDPASNDATLTITGDHLADSRVEADFLAVDNRVGLVARFSRSGDDFACYRLHINRGNEEVRLVRVEGTVDEATGTFDEEDRTVLWRYSDSPTVQPVDFDLSEYTLALTCVGDRLTVELNGATLATVQDRSPLASGQNGLYYKGSDAPVFASYVVRSAPADTPVHTWQFATSAYAGLVEHLDTFTGTLYDQQAEEGAAPLDPAALASALSSGWAEVEPLLAAATTARADRRAAAPEEMAEAEAALLDATADLDAAAAEHFDTLFALAFTVAYRPLPPVVELLNLSNGSAHQALLLELPEPLVWSRLDLRLQDADGAELPGLAWLWSRDGARAFIGLSDGTPLPGGDYTLHLIYRLGEDPLLSRNGSTVPEVAALSFAL